jgi:site-specific recombinase XerD
LRKFYTGSAETVPSSQVEEWSWPIDPSRYDRTSRLRTKEVSALFYLAARTRVFGHFPEHVSEALQRLLKPVDDVMDIVRPPRQTRAGTMTVLILEMHRRQISFWGWTHDDWCEVLCSSKKTFEQHYPTTNGHNRQMLFLTGYLLRLFDDFRSLGVIDRMAMTSRIFGRPRVQAAIKQVVDLLLSWGYGRLRAHDIQWALCQVLLANKSPRLQDITVDILEAERKQTTRHGRSSFLVLSRALAGLGIISRPLEHPSKRLRDRPQGDARIGVSPEWVTWVERWRATCTFQPSSRQRIYLMLLKAGRWVTTTHPDCVSPARWTRQLAAEWVATVCRMTIGEWTQRAKTNPKRLGKPLSAKARAHHLSSLSTFFRDLQEWEWIPRHFDPRRCFGAPRSLRALISPNPRILADDVWAKLLWAGLNLADADLPRSFSATKPYYPLAMVKALAMVWLFGGLRVDEIWRLRVGCTREQWNKSPEAGQGVCNLDVPVNKTSRAFTKPVDQIVGEAVRAWEAERPGQPPALDQKTGESAHFLFMFRSTRIAPDYLNRTLIPSLCRKAGLPTADARGTITSHRARSTIASQLFNAKEPMSLFELQKWLGHKWANSTQYYLDISPTKLANSYRDAGYFARNVRAIEVLIDRDVVKNGTAAREPWMYYDLGHGYCTFDFFEQCKFRMVCAKCSFYRPKTSTEAQLLEGKSNLMRLRQGIPLTESERAAVDDGVDAIERLLKQLADVPTPAGPTPRQLHPSGLVQLNVTPTKIISSDGADHGMG